jgi:hypothetical protein
LKCSPKERTKVASIPLIILIRIDLTIFNPNCGSSSTPKTLARQQFQSLPKTGRKNPRVLPKRNSERLHRSYSISPMLQQLGKRSCHHGVTRLSLYSLWGKASATNSSEAREKSWVFPVNSK